MKFMTISWAMLERLLTVSTSTSTSTWKNVAAKSQHRTQHQSHTAVPRGTHTGIYDAAHTRPLGIRRSGRPKSPNPPLQAQKATKGPTDRAPDALSRISAETKRAFLNRTRQGWPLTTTHSEDGSKHHSEVAPLTRGSSGRHPQVNDKSGRSPLARGPPHTHADLCEKTTKHVGKVGLHSSSHMWGHPIYVPL